MIEIREYMKGCEIATRGINYETSTSYHTPEKRELLWLLYHDYYPMFSRRDCFVALDTWEGAQTKSGKGERVVGYILCEPSFNNWERNYTKCFMPKLEKLSPEHAKMRHEEFEHYREIAKEYPAHLHINILPEFQGQGIGGRLIGALEAHLIKKGVRGVHLTTSVKKVPSIKLYERNGYELKAQFDGGVLLFAKKLIKE